MDIKKEVRKLKQLYDTSDPYEIAKRKGILILYEDLGNINGYYNMIYRQKQIHINHWLDENKTKVTLAHELGHAVMHPKASTPFYTHYTYLSVDKMEIEANRFAIELLLSDEELEEYKECTVETLTRILGYNKKLIELKLNN